MRGFLWVVGVVGVLAPLLGALPARAQAMAGEGKAEEVSASLPPWHKGVPEERKKKAQALFEEGKKLNEQLLLGEALDKYQEALSHWEHPQLRFYMARVQRRMGLPLLAYENLNKAMDWGTGALDAAQAEEARVILRVLEQKELGALKIQCDEPDAEVLLDGKPWFKGKGKERRVLLPGEHVVSGRKAGFYTMVKAVAVYAGKEASGVVRLSVVATLSMRRWAVWTPWAVLGAGAVLGAAGGALLASSTSNVDETTQRLRDTCGGSCAPDTAGPYEGSRIQQGFGVASLVVGGAGFIGGAAMILLNLPQSYRTQDDSDVKVELLPMALPTLAGVSTRFSF